MANDSKNKRPELKTLIPLEKHASELFTTTIFYEFQYELEIGCFNCGVEEIKKDNELYIFKLREGSRRRTFDVVFNPTTLETKCFCKMFEREEGNMLEKCINAIDKKMLLNDLWSKIHSCVSLVQNNEDDLSDLVNKLHALRMNLEHKKTTNASNTLSTKAKDIEMLIGATLPSKVLIKPPNISKNKGTGVHVPNQVNVPIDVHVPNEVHVPNDIHIPTNVKHVFYVLNLHCLVLVPNSIVLQNLLHMFPYMLQ
ncbi:uncharacterized protein LOC110739204 [Chenopodium quinoa]|uniref:uncharacterized protein LOC110739204 n=1 Tax=Chenopodium quinoa TaxID=63459 RepID=UPI000B785201|nr:uncharacterized protein LOC110739204 [Chenopodium quinoa]